MEKLIAKMKEMGIFKVSIIDVSVIETDSGFRTLCEQNSCGKYGRCHTCPPGVGEYEVLSKSLRNYKHALVYQTVSELEDSYDFEGMMDAGKRINDIAQDFTIWLKEEGYSDFLHLGAGGCRVCERCTKMDDLPCRFPLKAMASLEAYGIDVTALSKASDMKYINGQDTVTFFGAVFFKE